MLKINEQRHKTECEKWGKYQGKDVLPMWVADSEFEAAEVIQSALATRLSHGVLGYPEVNADFKNAVVSHCKALYGWEIEADWVLALPGVVPGLNVSRALAIENGRGRGLSLEPVYPHLRKHAGMLNFSETLVPHKEVDGYWLIDFDALEAAIKPDTGVLLLCHPQNPLGKVYSPTELSRLAALAQKHDLLVCSDEIHCDLVLNGSQHQPFAMQNQDTLKRTITLMAASKTYNIAGLCCSFAIIADESLRKRFVRSKEGLVGTPNLFGLIATIAALNEGEAWRQEHLAYLRENAQMVYERINATGVLKMRLPEATFLAWIDARGLNCESPQKFFEEHGVGLSAGEDYGMKGFVRLNFGCGREMLDKALCRIENALAHLKG
ncbi:MAG: PatB family C-S lyase [Cardiobacteriaceae bacterium]|nr:PatB family C-S lyase [Cardiobacteriaceae bacterium]